MYNKKNIIVLNYKNSIILFKFLKYNKNYRYNNNLLWLIYINSTINILFYYYKYINII